MRKLRDYRLITPGRCLNCFLRTGRVCHCSSNRVDGDVRHRLLIMFMFFPHTSFAAFSNLFTSGSSESSSPGCVQSIPTDDPEVNSIRTWKLSYVHVRNEISCDSVNFFYMYIRALVLNGCIYMYSQICE